MAAPQPHWGGTTARQGQGTPKQEEKEEGAAVGIFEGVSHQNTSSRAATAPACSCVSREKITPGTERGWDTKPVNIYCPLPHTRHRGRVPYILFLSLPFLAVPARRPKAICRSSCTRCRFRALRRFRPPLCRKRCLAALLRCFRICCLFFSSERTLPCAGGCVGPAGDTAELRGQSQAEGNNAGLTVQVLTVPTPVLPSELLPAAWPFLILIPLVNLVLLFPLLIAGMGVKGTGGDSSLDPVLWLSNCAPSPGCCPGRGWSPDMWVQPCSCSTQPSRQQCPWQDTGCSCRSR